MRRSSRRSARCTLLGLMWIGFLAGCGGSSPALPELGVGTGEPLPWWQRSALDRALDFQVWRGSRSGYVALIARAGRPVYARTTGWADVETATPMTLDTRFHLASMTKPVTAVAAMILVEDGRLSLDDRVDTLLPTFASPEVASRRSDTGYEAVASRTPMLVRHLLTFSSGIGGYEEKGDALDRAWRARNIERSGLGALADRIPLMRGLPLHEEPGVRWRYGWSMDVMARVVEVAAGEPYEAFVSRRIFAPLGMTRTAYPDGLTPEAGVAVLYTHTPEGELTPDEKYSDYGVGWSSGGGGLVSTASDYMRFALMLAGGGALGDVRILRPETVAEMTRVHVPGGVLADTEVDGLEGLGFGLGVSVVADAEDVILPADDGDYWWSGLFGTHFWVSPANDTVVVVMQPTARNEYSGLPVTPTIVQGIALF